ncbi:RICIN domain-containing protein [Streptomyces sp. GESEQ-35]|uniref:RICIN domain-containing protein n=1 Tax=Streptomyces sp. GESEQ-35 TaxID=2812657 RepID=UPI001B33C207|nr:RICIN domain-containing protein [Streptomyces sp. GESEQ-35]
MTERSISRRGALGTVAALGLTALLPAASPARAAASLRNGLYTISRFQRQLLTLDEAEGAVVILPPNAGGGQAWEVETLANGHTTIRNVKEGSYLGYAVSREINQPVMGNAVPVQWSLHEAVYGYHVVVPDTELALDTSPLLIHPPRTDLTALRSQDPAQIWQFRATSL